MGKNLNTMTKKEQKLKNRKRMAKKSRAQLYRKGLFGKKS